jgi:hypothetical protein
MSATAFVIKHSTSGLTFARELPEPQESKNHPRTAETTASTRTLPHEVSPPNDHEWDWQNTQTKSAKEANVETPSQSKNRWTDVWWSVHGDSIEQKRIETVTRRWCFEIESNEGARRREGCIKTNRALPVTVNGGKWRWWIAPSSSITNNNKCVWCDGIAARRYWWIAKDTPDSKMIRRPVVDSNF